MEINGKVYPMWKQFVERKDEMIGKILVSEEDGFEPMRTKVIDVDLTPNGNDSAMFMIYGEDFDCGFDVGHGGVTSNGDGIVFSSRYCGEFFIE